MFYLLLFFIVEVFALIITYGNKVDNKLKKFLLFSIIIVLSIVGGLRDFNIGVDVEVYGVRWFEVACKAPDFWSYTKMINTTDIGYLFINYFVSLFSNNVNVLLFVLQMICNGLVIITLYKFKDKVPFWLSLLFYLCVFYCRTFNLLRQAISLSIVFYSLWYLKEKKDFKFLILVLIASLFHFTALVGVIIFIFYKINKSNSNNRKILNILIILGTSLFVIYIKDIIAILYNMGIVNYRIYSYLFRYASDEIGIAVGDSIFKLIILLVVLMRIKFIKNNSSLNMFLFLSAILDFILFQSRNIILYSDRLSYYFGYFTMLIFPQTVQSLSRKNKEKMLFYIIFSALLVGYWYYKFVISGSCAVFPYSSDILGI